MEKYYAEFCEKCCSINIIIYYQENKMIEEIFQKIRPGANIKESKDIINDYSLDSFDVAGLIADIEEQYKINIAIEDINVENFRTYQSICDMIERNK